jgi:dipeptidyl aminopeptidase/acylaminoacyl peptidase
LPHWARDRPERALFRSNASGVVELHTWDRSTGAVRQLTDRPHGTAAGLLDVDGEWVWWFDDDHGDERGRWRRQPFAGGEAVPVDAGPLGYSAGIAVGREVALVGTSDDDGTHVHRVALRVDGTAGPPVPLYRHRESASIGPLSHDGTLVALAHTEHGDARNPALRILTPAGDVVADLWDGPGRGLEPVEWAPADGDARLLVMHDRGEVSRPLVWDVAAGSVTEIPFALEGEVAVDWWPDGRSLLVVHDVRGRSELYRHHLGDGRLERLPSPPGAIDAAAVRPDGAVWYLWSDAATPPAVRSTASEEPVLALPGLPAPPGLPADDRFVATPHGDVHAFVLLPAGPPVATIFDVHGGPEAHDTDSFHPRAQAWLDHGYAVVLVNYRGSDGYGKAWRDAIVGNPGLTELEDVAAVRDALVADGLVDPARLVLSGRSWGGYLTLLGLGTQPERWSHGVAVVPVADYVAAFEDEMEPLRAYDRALFGGSPDEVPEAYRLRSPITYVDAVTQPLLVIAGENDPRCPIRQIDRYLDALAALGRPAEVHRYDAGHGALVVDEAIRQVEVVLEFLHRHLGGPPPQ